MPLFFFFFFFFFFRPSFLFPCLPSLTNDPNLFFFFFSACAQVRLLLECGADPKAILAQGVTPLYTAARNGHAATLDLLLKSGAMVNARAEDGSTALVKAAQKGHLDALQVGVFLLILTLLDAPAKLRILSSPLSCLFFF